MVAIVALLIAILLPSLALARAQARRAVCGSNLSQITKAWHAYFDDNRGALLRGVTVNYSYGGLQGQGSSFFRVPKPLNGYLKLAPKLWSGGKVFWRIAAELYAGIADGPARAPT